MPEVVSSDLGEAGGDQVDGTQDQKLNFIVVDTWRTYKIAFHTCFLYMKAHISYTIF